MRDRTPPGFLKVARLSLIPEKEGKRITAGDEEITLWRVDGDDIYIHLPLEG